MESMDRLKDLVERMSIDTKKVFTKGNRAASVRARKNALEIRGLITGYRKEILDEMKRWDEVFEKQEENGKN